MSIHDGLHGSAARSRILLAARTLFSERGSEGVTMAEVAEAAAVSRGTVFNQFGSKHALVEAITEGVLDGYVAILDKALAVKDVPVPVLVRELFTLMGRGIESDRQFYRAVFREIARITVGLEEGGVAQRARLAAIERLIHLLTRGQARGDLRRDWAPEDLATAFDSLVFGTITHWLYDDTSEPLPDRMRRAADVLLGPVATEEESSFAGPVPDLSVPRVERMLAPVVPLERDANPGRASGRRGRK
jgi:AcrR family transcriptional regulator